MAVEWVDVADSAVKIGLGALITIVGGWITLKLTHRHEIRKELAAQRLRDIEKNRPLYRLPFCIANVNAEISIRIM
jgi:hypothetical protein